MCRKWKWGIRLFLFICLLLCIPMNSQAYFGTNEDYLLTDTKPKSGTTGHFLEFISEETYTVEPGDTLWKIAEAYWGEGSYYRKILSDNADVIDEPDLILPGTVLKLEKTLYTGAGLLDYIDTAVFRSGSSNVSDAFDIAEFYPPYQIFTALPYWNDLTEADPYTNWEEFQEEVRACSKEVCGERVSELSFERYQVTGAGVLGWYSFTFDADDREYVVMACFCYNSTTKSEAFAVCDKERCTKEQIREAKGKVFYAAVRYLDPGAHIAKTEEYVGAGDWKYPQLRNPFTCAMRRLCTGPLLQVEDYPGDHVIEWQEAAFEELVREELAALWQLTLEEKLAFMERDMTAADLCRIEELELRYYPPDESGGERLYLQLNGNEINGMLGSTVSAKSSQTSQWFTTLEDLENFPELKKLTLDIEDSDITDLSAIGKLTKLRTLDCRIYSADKRVENMDFLSSLTDLRVLFLRGVKIWGPHFTQFFNDVTDLSVLRNCPHLAYFYSTAGNVESYDFLEDLPEIYYIELDSEGDCRNVRPDVALLPNACFIEFYGDSIRYEVGDGYERPLP